MRTIGYITHTDHRTGASIEDYIIQKSGDNLLIRRRSREGKCGEIVHVIEQVMSEFVTKSEFESWQVRVEAKLNAS